MNTIDMLGATACALAAIALVAAAFLAIDLIRPAPRPATRQRTTPTPPRHRPVHPPRHRRHTGRR